MANTTNEKAAEKQISAVEKRADEIRLEMQELELEELRQRVDDRRQANQAKSDKARRNEENLANYRRDQEKAQKICNHRKGGKDKFYKGSDAQYALFKNVYPLGNIEVICTRCHKEWKQPNVQLRKENPALYKKQLEDYLWAMDAPTDNEQAGTQIFVVTEVPNGTVAA